MREGDVILTIRASGSVVNVDANCPPTVGNLLLDIAKKQLIDLATRGDSTAADAPISVTGRAVGFRPAPLA